MSEKTLTLSQDKVLAGVVGGLAEYFGFSAGKLRIVYVLVSILSAAFPGILVYIVLWFLMPHQTDKLKIKLNH